MHLSGVSIIDFEQVKVGLAEKGPKEMWLEKNVEEEEDNQMFSMIIAFHFRYLFTIKTKLQCAKLQRQESEGFSDLHGNLQRTKTNCSNNVYYAQ